MRKQILIGIILILPQLVLPQIESNGDTDMDLISHPDDQNCAVCHLKKYFQTDSPDHKEFAYQPRDCSQCHSTDRWTPDIFSHDDVRLNESCIACHIHQLKMTNLNLQQHDLLPNDCRSCHNTDDWKAVGYQHTGKNYTVPAMEPSQTCLTCHTNGFLPKNSICPGCNPAEDREDR